MDFVHVYGVDMCLSGEFASSVHENNRNLIGFYKLDENGYYSEISWYHRDWIPKIVEVLEYRLQEYQEKTERPSLAFVNSSECGVFACSIFRDRVLMFGGDDGHWWFTDDFAAQELYGIIANLKNYVE
jgi:hypothetical protein